MMKWTSLAVLAVGGVLGAGVSAAMAVNMEYVTVGDPGNPADTEVMSTDGTTGYGSVDTVYRIAKYEVTNGQYCEFLNAIAPADDPHGLYSTEMASGWEDMGGIVRTGSPGGYAYTVRPGRQDRPVSYVSFWDAARFANWLHNGQPTTGVQDQTTTEDGAYFLNGLTYPFGGTTREPDARVWVPSEDEWYKAAYYDPALIAYHDYPTGSDAIPSNDLVDPDPGNSANFFFPHDAPPPYTIGSPYWVTEVGEFENSQGSYGTFDQGGNVWEWNDSIVVWYGSHRGIRGGSFHNNEALDSYIYMTAAVRGGNYPDHERSLIGFRVATVPEPATLALLVVGCLAVIRPCRRRRAEQPTRST